MLVERERLFPIIRKLKDKVFTNNMIELCEEQKKVRSWGLDILDPLDYIRLLKRFIP